jgi:hypothetical protein
MTDNVVVLKKRLDKKQLHNLILQLLAEMGPTKKQINEALKIKGLESLVSFELVQKTNDI